MKVMLEFILTRGQLATLDSGPPPDEGARALLRQIAESMPLDGPPDPINIVLECMRVLAARGSLTEMQAFYYMLSIPYLHRTMHVETYDVPMNLTRAVMVTLNITEHRQVSVPAIATPSAAPHASVAPTTAPRRFTMRRTRS